MTDQEAYQKLKASLSRLHERQGHISVSDLETEVINLACLEVLRRRKEQDFTTGPGLLDLNVHEMFKYAQQERSDGAEIALAFSRAAKQVTPRYDDSHALKAVTVVQEKCDWAGIWDFLRQYYQEKHGIDIDASDAEQESSAPSEDELFQQMDFVDGIAEDIGNSPAEGYGQGSVMENVITRSNFETLFYSIALSLDKLRVKLHGGSRGGVGPSMKAWMLSEQAGAGLIDAQIEVLGHILSQPDTAYDKRRLRGVITSLRMLKELEGQV